MSERTNLHGLAASADQRRDRARGALLGLAIGDALFAEGGPRAGTSTRLATGLALSLKAHGRFFATDVTSRYVELAGDEADVDDVTRASLAMIARGVSIGEASRRAFLHVDRAPSSDAPLARVAPIGVALSESAAMRRLAALADCAITHYEPKQRIACAAFCAAIAEATAGRSDPASMLAAARNEIDLASAALVDLVPRDGPDATIARDALLAELDSNDAPTSDEAFVQGAFALAFDALRHAPSFASALDRAAFRGPFASTRAAVVGALSGARFGEAAIPTSLVERARGADGKSALAPLLELAGVVRSSRD